MFSSPEPPRITNLLRNTTEKPGNPTMAHVPITSARLPVVIPGSGRRRQSAPQISTSPRRRPIVFAIVLSGCVVMLVAAALFVVPLDNGQEQIRGLQAFGNWISSRQFGALNPSQHVDPPTPTPALLTNDGYCGGSNLWGTCATAITASGVMGTGHMHHPILGAVITQYFGHMEYQMWCGCWRPHTGIDLAAPFGTAIMAADSGQVIWTGWDVSGLGWAVKINHGRYIGTVYGHMERFIVKVGQNVIRGQVIGYEGSTGASTGPHVHFMVLYNNIWVNPLDYVQLP
jgi:murein DD-endopeptidase MepM/ murein hydrolase activator NlpD